MELLVSNLERRALATGDNPVHPRLCDLQMLLPAITGKVEMVYEGEQQGAEVVARRLLGQAVKKVFDGRFPEVGKEVGSGGEDDKRPLRPHGPLVRRRQRGDGLRRAAVRRLRVRALQGARPPGSGGQIRQGPRRARLRRRDDPRRPAPAPEARPRQDLDSQISYKEMVKFQLLKPHRGAGRGGRDRGDIN